MVKKTTYISYKTIWTFDTDIHVDLVLTCAMMLYAEDGKMPLPTQEEVLICTSQTTAEEVHIQAV